jgi:soluble P-type ATPase
MWATFSCKLVLCDFVIDAMCSAEYPVALLQVTYEKSHLLLDLLVKIVQYLSVTGSSPFHYKGAAIQKFVDLLKIVFRASNERTGHIDQLKRCFKVSRMSYVKICITSSGADVFEQFQEEGAVHYSGAPVNTVLR